MNEVIQWKKVIKPKTNMLDLKLNEVWQYKDLIYMFVKRSFTSQYKQTILGPLWFIINPLITTVLFTVVFGGIANISTEGAPQFLFYMAGNALWSYFAACINETSRTFTANANIFGKVYFPRLTMPIATVIFSAINLIIQLIMLICFMAYFKISGQAVHPNIYVLTVPIMLLQVAFLGLGFGIIISSLTTKYRDLQILVGFGISLWMYITPVVYPVSKLSGVLRKLVMLNPMSPIVNNFRYAVLGCGSFELEYWIISMAVTLVVLLIGIVIFNRVEKTFMDTV